MPTLKELRTTAHLYFDTLWLYKFYYCGKTINYWRGRQYDWLAKKLEIPRKQCHMARFNKSTCISVINICAEEFVKNDKLITFAEKMEEGKMMNWYNKRK